MLKFWVIFFQQNNWEIFGFSSVNSTKFDIFGGNQNPNSQYQKN